MKQLTYVYANRRPTNIAKGIISNVDYAVLRVGHYGLVSVKDVMKEMNAWRGLPLDSKTADGPFDCHYGNTSISYENVGRSMYAATFAQRPTYFYKPCKGHVALNRVGMDRYKKLVHQLIELAAG